MKLESDTPVKKIMKSTSVLLLCFVFLGSSTTSALSKDQLRIYNKNILYYDLDPCSGLQANQNDASGNGGAKPGPIYIMGDSITELAKDTYEKTFKQKGWKPTVEGLSGRHISQSSPSPSGLGQIDKDKDVIKKADTIVIALGTNDEGNSETSIRKDVRRTVDKIKEYSNSPNIFWVNVIDANHDADSIKTNQAIEDGFGNKDHIIEWYGEAKSKADLGSFNEGVHPTKQQDIDTLVSLVYKRVNQVNGASTNDGTTSGTTTGAAKDGVNYDNTDSADTNYEVAVETDGADPNPGNDSNHQSGTSYGHNLGWKTHFVALNPGWDKINEHNLKLGDLVSITWHGKTVYAIWGDNHSGGGVHTEVSLSVAMELTGKTNEKQAAAVGFGTKADPVKFTIYPNTHQKISGDPPSQSLIDKVGQEASGGASSSSNNSSNNSCGCGGSSNAGNTNLTGSDNAEKIFNFFVSKGLKPYQAAGIIGNMAHESGLEPQRLQGTAAGVVTPADDPRSGGTGWGLVQFTPGSKFINPTKTAGKDPNDLGVQLDFVWDQLEGRQLSEKQAGDDIKASPNVEEATKAFQGTKNAGGQYFGYERPADENATIGARIQTAKDTLSKFGSGSGGSASGSSPDGTACASGDKTGGDSGEASGDYALPVAKKFYEQNKEWFTKPHHDHASADIPVPDGTAVYSMTAGKIILAPAGGDCGNGLFIKTPDGTEYGYCHGTDGGTISGAKQGDTVKPGQLIMHTDNTGHSEGTHLHLQIKVNGTLHCPQNLFVAIAEGKTIPKEADLPTSGCSY